MQKKLHKRGTRDRWINKFTNELKENVDRMNRVSKLKPVLFKGYQPLEHADYYLDKVLDVKYQSSKNPSPQASNLELLYRASDLNLDLLESFQR